MRIAQVAPLFESVPPRLYGGTERVVSFLTEDLVELGHEVTLFASGESRTRARLVASHTHSLRFDGDCRDPVPHHYTMLEAVRRLRRGFDVLHFHVDYLHFPLSRSLGWRHVTTLHGRLDSPDLRGLYREYAEMPLVSVSAAQQRPLPGPNWRASIHHGLPPDLLQLGNGGGDHLVFLGRVSPEKGLERAIEIARRADLRLRIAAKIDAADRDYFDTVIGPLLSPGTEMVGEIGDAEKNEFLGRARALLFPIDWPEPFGLVMIEALACGTPVIAWRCGSTPEVIDDGVTGFLVGSVDEAVAAVGRLSSLRRTDCRAAFEARFTVRRMTEEYLAVYRSLGAGVVPRGAEAS